VISVVSNVDPAGMAQMVDAFFAGNWAVARELHYRLFPIAEAMFLETNPVPAKTALGLMGRMSPEVRLPLCPMGEKNRERLAEVLRAAGLLAR
jgi:4-hydroxy-tetrahydrodipicolinate synthase